MSGGPALAQAPSLTQHRSECSQGLVHGRFVWGHVEELQNFYWDEDEINQRLMGIMKQSFAGVWDYAKAQAVPMRQGALMLAVDKVADAVQQRGIWP